MPAGTTHGFDGPVYDILMMPDGKMYICGAFSLYKGEPALGLIRLMPNGNRDYSYDIGTGFDISGNLHPPTRLLAHPDGGIVCGLATTHLRFTRTSEDLTQLVYQGVSMAPLIWIQADGSLGDNTQWEIAIGDILRGFDLIGKHKIAHVKEVGGSNIVSIKDLSTLFLYQWSVASTTGFRDIRFLGNEQVAISGEILPSAVDKLVPTAKTFPVAEVPLEMGVWLTDLTLEPIANWVTSAERVSDGKFGANSGCYRLQWDPRLRRLFVGMYLIEQDAAGHAYGHWGNGTPLEMRGLLALRVGTDGIGFPSMDTRSDETFDYYKQGIEPAGSGGGGDSGTIYGYTVSAGLFGTVDVTNGQLTTVAVLGLGGMHPDCIALVGSDIYTYSTVNKLGKLANYGASARVDIGPAFPTGTLRSLTVNSSDVVYLTGNDGTESMFTVDLVTGVLTTVSDATAWGAAIVILMTSIRLSDDVMFIVYTEGGATKFGTFVVATSTITNITTLTGGHSFEGLAFNGDALYVGDALLTDPNGSLYQLDTTTGALTQRPPYGNQWRGLGSSALVGVGGAGGALVGEDHDGNPVSVPLMVDPTGDLYFSASMGSLANEGLSGSRLYRVSLSGDRDAGFASPLLGNADASAGLVGAVVWSPDGRTLIMGGRFNRANGAEVGHILQLRREDGTITTDSIANFKLVNWGEGGGVRTWKFAGFSEYISGETTEI